MHSFFSARNSHLPRLALVLILIGSVGCGSDSPSEPGAGGGGGGTSASDVQTVVDAAGKLAPLGPDSDVIVGTPTVEEVGDYRYTYEVHDVVDNITDIAYLGLNDDIVWPGNLVKGDRAHFFVYDPVTLPRSPLTLSVSLETSNAGEGLAVTVDDPKLSTIRQGISDLLQDAITDDTNVPARVEFSYEQIYNKSHMSMSLDTDISYGLGDLETAFDWTNTQETTKIVAKYKQIYYSIDMDTPQNAAAMFPNELTTAELTGGMPAGAMPMYVAGVSYGMMAIMTMESTFKYESMNLAIDAAYSGTVEVEVEAGFTAQQVLEQSNIRIVVYGGSTAGLQNIELNFAGLMNVINASSNFSRNTPGVPLVYKFRHLKDNTLALVTQTSQYTLVRPLKLRQKVRVTARNFICEMSDDEGAGDVDMDRFAVDLSAYNRFNETEPLSPIIEGHRIYNWSTSGDVTMGAGYVWTCSAPNSYDVTFNTDLYDFDLGELQLAAYARDWDGSFNDPEASWGYTTIKGDRLLDNGGAHSFQINNRDFRFRVEILVELIN